MIVNLILPHLVIGASFVNCITCTGMMQKLFVRFELDRQLMIWNSRKSMGLTVLPDAAAKLSPNHRLAWLLGRVAVDGLPVVDAY